MRVNFGCMGRAVIPHIIAVKITWVFVLKHLTDEFTEHIDTMDLRWVKLKQVFVYLLLLSLDDEDFKSSFHGVGAVSRPCSCVYF